MADDENEGPDLGDFVADLYDRMTFMEMMMRLVIADAAVNNEGLRITLEDMLWQAKERQPPSGENVLTVEDLHAQYDLLEEFVSVVNTMLSKPLVARAASKEG